VRNRILSPILNVMHPPRGIKHYEGSVLELRGGKPTKLIFEEWFGQI